MARIISGWRKVSCFGAPARVGFVPTFKDCVLNNGTSRDPTERPSSAARSTRRSSCSSTCTSRPARAASRSSAARSQLPKSTAHRLLASLSRRGLVERDALGRYRPGIALVALGLGVLEREPLVEASRARSRAHRRDAGRDDLPRPARARAGSYVLDKQEGTGFLRAAPRVGSEIPAHATAIGKLYLAFAPEELRRADATLHRFTRATLVEPGRARARDRARARERLRRDARRVDPGSLGNRGADPARRAPVRRRRARRTESPFRRRARARLSRGRGRCGGRDRITRCGRAGEATRRRAQEAER